MTDFQDLLLARLRWRQGLLPEAQRLLEALRHEAESAGRGWTVLQAQALHALVLHAQGYPAQALQALTHLVARAAPEGYVRLFLDEGEPMRRLLSALDEQAGLRGPARAHLKALIGTSPTSPAVAYRPPPVQPALVEPLSARELEVLRLMAEGGSNQDLAKRLFISVGTVKSHITHILGKLTARNRTEAVARARTFGLL